MIEYKMVKTVVITVFILSFISGFQATREEIFKTTEGGRIESKIRAMANLTRRCIIRKDVKPLIISSLVPDILLRYLHRLETTSITSIAISKLNVDDSYSRAMRTSMATYLDERRFRFSWKSQGVLLFVTSVVQLIEQLDRLKDSRWWNSRSRFLLVNQYSTAEDCNNAYDLLSLAWNRGLLSTVFMCMEQDNTTAIYSYNPFGSTAPQPWVKVREVKGLQGHPWNLFKTEKFDGRRFACGKIYFDKTKSLSGYPIFVSGKDMAPLLSIVTETENIYDRYTGEDGALMTAIWGFLNASMVEVDVSNNNVGGWISANGTFHGNMIDIVSGKVDIALNSMILGPIWKVTSTYPHTSQNMCFVTKDRGYVPWLIGLLLIIDGWSLTSGFSVTLIGVIIFGYFDRHRYLPALLNMVRVIHNSAYHRPPVRIPLRMILFFISLLPLVFYSTIQGKILSLMKNPLRSQNIDKITDMSEYTMQGPDFLREHFVLVASDIRFVVATLQECIRNIYQDKRVACTHYCPTLTVKALQTNTLHLASERSPYILSRFIAKPDWSLIERFDTLLLRLVESGLTNFYRDGSLYADVQSFLNIQSGSRDTSDVAVIDLDDFHYLFRLVGIGWMIAAVVFVVELLVHRKKGLRVSNLRITPAATESRISNISRFIR